jgi:hypothetical protein
MWGVEVYNNAFMNSALDVGESSKSHASAVFLRENKYSQYPLLKELVRYIRDGGTKKWKK